MFRFPWFRRILCVILAVVFCCSIVLTPLAAQAITSVQAAVVAVSIISAVVSVAQGCGVMPGPNISIYEALAKTIANTIDPVYKYVSDKGLEYLKMYKVGDKLFLPKVVAQSVIDIIIDSGYVSRVSSTGNDVSGSNYGYSVSDVLNNFCNKFSNLILTEGFTNIVIESNETTNMYSFLYLSTAPSFVSDVSSSKVTYRWPVGTKVRSYSIESASSFFVSNTFTASETHGFSCLEDEVLYHGPVIYSFSSDKVLLGNFADNIDDEKYLPWQQSGIGITLPGSDGEEDYLPVGVPPDISADWGQDKAQSGEIGISEDSIIDTGETVPVTRPGDYVDTGTSAPTIDTSSITSAISSAAAAVVSAVSNVATAVSTAISSAIADIKAFFGSITFEFGDITVSDFAVDLSSFFPFCIPYDLYCMLDCLVAEPEIPIFDLAFPLPGGSAAEFTLDLTMFDDIASLVRIFEVVLFCVGLTISTRKFIKW